MNKKRLGVVGVVPFWSQAGNMNADSNYAYLRLVLPEMVKQTEDTVFLVFWPDPQYGRGHWRYFDDGLQSDRVRFITWPYATNMRMSVLGFDPTRFGEIEDRYGCNIYWLHQVESGAAFHGGYWGGMSKKSNPALVSQHHYIVHSSLPMGEQQLFGRKWAQIVGSVASNRVVCNSEYTYSMLNSQMAALLSPNEHKGVLDKLLVQRFGTVRGDEPEAPPATDNDPIRIVYNHRFENYKQPHVTGDVLQTLRAEGFNFEVWATQAQDQKTSHLPIDALKSAPSRLDYLRNIAVPAINTINSVHETFCIAIMDSMSLGHLIVAPKAVTFPELLPVNYPYLFRDAQEQTEMLREIMTDWPTTYNAWRLILRHHAQDQFALATYVERYLDILAAAENEQRDQQSKDHIAAGMDDIFNALRPQVNYQVLEVRKRIWTTLKMATQSCPTRRVIREALERGLHVNYERGQIVVRRDA